ncbi:MAG TPA: hypothetical protein VGC34_06080 [Steroidobacteraceae bacterium]
MTNDFRGWRIALVPEALINPTHRRGTPMPDVLGVLEATGYGILQLPPSGEHRLLLAVIADQVAEYAHHGYAVAAVGIRGVPGDGLHWRRLAPLLRHRGVSLPPRFIVRPDVDAVLEGRRLSELLANHDLPVTEQQHWRV